MLNDFITEYSIEGVDHKLDIEKALEQLDKREREILSLRLYGCSNAEIGRIVGYSSRQIGRILKNLSENMRKVTLSIKDIDE